jgi:hypothetical protein
MTHTPGPWFSGSLFETEYEKVVSVGPFETDWHHYGDSIAEVFDANGNDAVSNACLIAAAPDLLEACEKALARFESEKMFGPDRVALEEAIKKAKGK